MRWQWGLVTRLRCALQTKSQCRWNDSFSDSWIRWAIIVGRGLSYKIACFLSARPQIKARQSSDWPKHLTSSFLSLQSIAKWLATTDRIFFFFFFCPPFFKKYINVHTRYIQLIAMVCPFIKREMHFKPCSPPRSSTIMMPSPHSSTFTPPNLPSTIHQQPSPYPRSQTPPHCPRPRPRTCAPPSSSTLSAGSTLH